MISKKTLTIRTVILLVCLAGFGIIAWFMATNRISAFDDAIRLSIYNMRSPLMSAIMIPITYLGNWQTITGASVLLILIKKTRFKLGFSLGLSALGSNFVKSIAKDAFRRPRPDKALHIIEQGGYSFPSGHSMTGLVFYGMFAYAVREMMLEEHRRSAACSGHPCAEKAKELKALKRRADIVTVCFIALALLIGISRIYVGVHYPSDVLAGWCLGTAVLMVAITIRDIINTKKT